MTSSLAERYWKVAKSCAMFHLEDWWVVIVSGKDVRDFLQRLGTADVKNLKPGESVQTLFLGGDGRMVAECVAVCESDDRFVLLAPNACGQNLIDQLDRFLFNEDVKIEGSADKTFIAMIAGPAADQLSNSIMATLADSHPPAISTSSMFGKSIRRNFLLLDLADFSDVKSVIYHEVEKIDGVIGDADLYELLRIEAGLPEYGKDLSDKVIPLEAGLKTAISFTKGCFPGQEIVARINNLGHPANVLVGLKVKTTTSPLIGCKLEVGDKVVGRITSLCYSPVLGMELMLGFTKWAHKEPGTKLKIVVAEGHDELLAEIVELPVGFQHDL